MLSQKFRCIRYTGIGLCSVIFLGLMIFPVFIGSAAGVKIVNEEKEINIAGRAIVKSPRGYNAIERAVSDCSPIGLVLREFKTPGDPLAPASTLCINGALAIPDPDFDRPTVSSNVNGGVGAACTLSGNVTDYDVYSFNLTGCAAFPTDVTITTCGPAGCLPDATTDTTMYLYRNVAAGDVLQANGGLPGVFNAASPCTNLRGANALLSGGTSNTPPNGNSCNQVSGTCVGACAANTNTSGMARRLGNGRFTIVITENGAGGTGNYNLYVDAPSAGCVVALAPSAANGGISGRVLTPGGRGISKTTVTISGGSLARPVSALTNAFGYYNFSDLEAGQTYTVSVSAKGVQFANPTQIVTVQDELAGVDFVSIE